MPVRRFIVEDGPEGRERHAIKPTDQTERGDEDDHDGDEHRRRPRERMKGSAGHEKTWVEQVAAAIVVAALFGLLWRPASSSALSGDHAERVAELAALLGDPVPESAAIERILPAATRFPPSAEASHSLADALAACGMSDVSEPRRVQLARVIYAITTGGDLSRDRLTQMLEE